MPSFEDESREIRELLLKKSEEEYQAFLRHYSRRNGVLLNKNSALIHSDALDWLHGVPDNSLHAVVTDAPRDIGETQTKQDAENERISGAPRARRWNVTASLRDVRSTASSDLGSAEEETSSSEFDLFVDSVASELMRVLVPGAHVFIASSPQRSTHFFSRFLRAGFEKRGEIIRLVETHWGGERPRSAKDEFLDVIVTPLSCWEPWGLFRKPVENSVVENLRQWGTGGLRCESPEDLFQDLIACSPASQDERSIAPHPYLKPQKFLRKVVRAALPLGTGIILDPFAGAGSTVAAAASMGYFSIGIEHEREYFEMACNAFGPLKDLDVGRDS